MDTLLPSEQRPLAVLRPHEKGRFSRAFSIIEVTLAIAVMATMFIAVLGLLPAGMRMSEAASGTNAQSRIVAHITSLMQTGGYKKVLDQNRTNALYYYDVEGNYLDSDTASIPSYTTKRVYAARAIALSQNIPNGIEKFSIERTASKVMVVMGRNDSAVADEIRKLTDEESIKKLPGGVRVKMQAVLLSRMDSEMDP
jgi:uncharacterized protein (TIGR02598 family)